MSNDHYLQNKEEQFYNFSFAINKQHDDNVYIYIIVIGKRVKVFYRSFRSFNLHIPLTIKGFYVTVFSVVMFIYLFNLQQSQQIIISSFNHSLKSHTMKIMTFVFENPMSELKSLFTWHLLHSIMPIVFLL